MTQDTLHRILAHGSPEAAALMLIPAFLLGGWLTRRDAREWPLPSHIRFGLFASVFAAGLAGCAIPAFLAGDLVGSLAFLEWRGPKTILGGLLGGFLGAAAFKRLTGTAFDTSDAFARGTCLMMAVGRLGCVARHCCFGIEVPPWAGRDYGDGVARLPVQWIEATLVFALFLFLQRLHRHGRLKNRRFFVLLFAYGILRFLLEFLREPIAGATFGIGFYQWLALLVAAVGAFQIRKRTPAAGALPAGATGLA